VTHSPVSSDVNISDVLALDDGTFFTLATVTILVSKILSLTCFYCWKPARLLWSAPRIILAVYQMGHLPNIHIHVGQLRFYGCAAVGRVGQGANM